MTPGDPSADQEFHFSMPRVFFVTTAATTFVIYPAVIYPGFSSAARLAARKQVSFFVAGNEILRLLSRRRHRPSTARCVRPCNFYEVVLTINFTVNRDAISFLIEITAGMKITLHVDCMSTHGGYIVHYY